MSRVQFQRGLSFTEFFERYSSEVQCQAALERVRWPGGFVCPRCGGAEFSRVATRTQPLFQCTACRHQTSLIAGTVMQAMAVREQRYMLCDLVQLDDAHLGGERAGSKRGCGSQNKVPLVAALWLDASCEASRGCFLTG